MSLALQPMVVQVIGCVCEPYSLSGSGGALGILELNSIGAHGAHNGCVTPLSCIVPRSWSRVLESFHPQQNCCMGLVVLTRSTPSCRARRVLDFLPPGRTATFGLLVMAWQWTMCCRAKCVRTFLTPGKLLHETACAGLKVEFVLQSY
jgi:hypothetical protein